MREIDGPGDFEAVIEKFLAWRRQWDAAKPQAA
jgi:hypothetical protein